MLPQTAVTIGILGMILMKTFQHTTPRKGKGKRNGGKGHYTQQPDANSTMFYGGEQVGYDTLFGQAHIGQQHIGHHPNNVLFAQASVDSAMMFISPNTQEVDVQTLNHSASNTSV